MLVSGTWSVMGWPMACDPSRPMCHAGHWPSVVTCPGHLAMGANGLNSPQTRGAVLQLVRDTIECFLLGINNLSSAGVSALLYSITRGKNVWSCHGGNDGPQQQTIPGRTHNIRHPLSSNRRRKFAWTLDWTLLLPAWNDWTWCDEAEVMCQHLSPGEPWQGEILWPDPHHVTDQSEASIGWCWPIRRLAWSYPGRGHRLVTNNKPRAPDPDWVCQDPDKTSKMWPGQDKSPPSISSLKLNFDPRGLKHWELVRSESE